MSKSRRINPLLKFQEEFSHVSEEVEQESSVNVQPVDNDVGQAIEKRTKIEVVEVTTDDTTIQANDTENTEDDKREDPKYFRLALSEETHKYIGFMAKYFGISMTKYINRLIEKDREINNPLYEKLLDIEKIREDALNNIR